MLESTHRILIIKNGNKYLQYYDTRWESYLFLNTKDNESKLKEFVEKLLNVKVNKVELKFDKIHTKFSVSANKEKKYHHFFYLVDIDFKKKYISEDRKYKWFTKEELENDKRIMEVNSDILNFIFENNI